MSATQYHYWPFFGNEPRLTIGFVKWKIGKKTSAVARFRSGLPFRFLYSSRSWNNKEPQQIWTTALQEPLLAVPKRNLKFRRYLFQCFVMNLWRVWAYTEHLSAYSVKWGVLHLACWQMAEDYLWHAKTGGEQSQRFGSRLSQYLRHSYKFAGARLPCGQRGGKVVKSFPILWALRISVTFLYHREASAWWSNALRAVAKLCQDSRSCRVKVSIGQRPNSG